MKKIWITATVLLLTSASSFASLINWTTDAVISDASDVLTSGTKVEAFNITTGYDNTLDRTVNGVVFDPLIIAGAGQFGSAFSGLTGNLDYDAMLNRANFNISQPLSVGNGNLMEGRTYAIQVWYTDDRPNFRNRTGFYGDGQGNQVFLTGGNAEGFGEYGIGIFTADDTGSQTLNIGPGTDEQLNAYQIRDITDVSAPATTGMLGMSVLSILLFRRKLQS